MSDEMKKADSTLGLAAAVTERACELIKDGWVKGRMHTAVDGAPVQFCIHGALDLALEEIFGQKTLGAEAEVLATAFIVDEAQTQYNFKGSWKNGGIPAAGFNDSAATKHQDVLSVMTAAAERLWGLALEQEFSSLSENPHWAPSKWADVDVQSEDAQQLLYATLN
jgi:hypothetical protein